MMQGFSAAWRRLLLALLVMLIVAALVLWQAAGRSPSVPDSSPPLSLEQIVQMLQSDQPEIRAAACAWIGRSGETQLASLLFPRMSDGDWRVRAAAFEAMRRIGSALPDAPRNPLPLRDTPADEREQTIFAWLAAWRSAEGTSGSPVSPPSELCELYAPNGHWLSGSALAQACLSCHAPSESYTFSDHARCADCHAQEHASWAVSAHAQSVTHIGLKRVNERTKQVEHFDFGDRLGIGCMDCHKVALSTRGAPPPGTEQLDPPHHFEPVTPSTCAACHAAAHHEWQRWMTSRRPRETHWPPGEVAWDDQPESRDCVSCHMPASSAAPAHDFAVRRDPQLLRDGLHARIEPAGDDRGPQLVLTNLAGHANPTGTIRRGLRIEVTFDDDEQTRRVLMRLTSSPWPGSAPHQPALAPAEQRRIDLPLIEGARRITCEIIYERNHIAGVEHEVTLHRVSASVSR